MACGFHSSKDKTLVKTTGDRLIKASFFERGHRLAFSTKSHTFLGQSRIYNSNKLTIFPYRLQILFSVPVFILSYFILFYFISCCLIFIFISVLIDSRPFTRICMEYFSFKCYRFSVLEHVSHLLQFYFYIPSIYNQLAVLTKETCQNF